MAEEISRRGLEVREQEHSGKEGERAPEAEWIAQRLHRNYLRFLEEKETREDLIAPRREL